LVCAQDLPPVGAKIDLRDYRMTWSDEFSGAKLDPKKWQAPAMDRQSASSRWDPEMVTVRNGMLRLKVEPLAGDGPKFRCGAVRTRPDYDASRTYFQQALGYFEVRARLFRELRTDAWFAFWILAGEMVDGQTDSRKGSEIDIVESFRAFEGKVSGALHWGGYGQTLNSAGFEFPTLPELTKGGFHRYGLLWLPTGYAFTIDGVVVAQMSAVGLGRKERTLSQGACLAPGYLKLTVEAAPWSGPSPQWEPNPVASDEALVDWVRVYRLPLR
jgi:beta-glucanase (GH16 family)